MPVTIVGFADYPLSLDMLHELFTRLFRHPFVLAATAILALLLVAYVVAAQPPTYRSSASIVLLNPPDLPEATSRNPTIPRDFENPYARFGDLSVIVDILVRRIESEAVVADLAARGLDGSFEVAANRDFYRGPIIDIAAESTDAAAAMKNVQLVNEELRSQLTELQSAQGTDPRYWIGAEPITDPSESSTVLTPTIRALIVGLAGGVLLIVAAGLIADSIGNQRRMAETKQRAQDRERGEPLYPAPSRATGHRPS